MRISHLFHTLDFWRAHLAVNREPVWENILPLFFFHRDGVLAIQRLTRDWTRLYGLRQIDVFRGSVFREKWSSLRIGEVLDHMQNTSDARSAGKCVTTKEKPRYVEGSLVVVRTQDKDILIDGRRRANLWRSRPGEYGVWIIEVDPRPSRLLKLVGAANSNALDNKQKRFRG
ncbi:hypothetical protein [Brucella oryzae]|uniref:Uncharacterized protein n=1 Tax=Brucella oryzae TaxID=335286 RepID=A0A2S7J4U1_9HYPH|nr:hypothetical protein [Brucella oryzae]MBR7652390.1 hypothetical protein [Brucella oryzae]PQA75253.1 hypothetical protein C3731_01350 [Brucella oryzae]